MRDPVNVQPQQRGRWLRFSLRTLLLISTVSGIFAYGLHWNRLRKEAETAWSEFERTWASLEADVATNDDYYVASKNLCHAECNVPLHSKVAAHATHLARIQKYTDNFEAMLAASVYDLEWAEKERHKLAGYCAEAEEWLAAAQRRPLLPK